MIPIITATRPPVVKIRNVPPQAAMVSTAVRIRWPRQDRARSSRRKIGSRPKISIEKRVKEKTCVVDGRREASTADAIMAELVDIEAGNLSCTLVFAGNGGKNKHYRDSELAL